MWYSLHEILSYNCLFHFIIGNRGGGKTYAAKKWAIKDFLKNGKQFIYLRRYKSEFYGKKKKKFFDDIKKEFPDIELEQKGMEYYINGQLAGYAIALSTALMEKSVPYPDVNKIIFDEFVIDSKVVHYLSNEVHAFMELYETISRLRDDVRVLFLSNAVSVVNPYFTYFNLQPNGDKRFYKYGHIIVEFYVNPEFVEMKKKTRFGQIIDGTKYGDYAINNKYLKDNENFVEKRSKNAIFQFSILYNQHNYGIWYDYKAGLMFVCREVDPSHPMKFCLSTDEHGENLLLLKSGKKSHSLSRMIRAFELGCLRFDDMMIKNQMIEIIGKMM